MDATHSSDVASAQWHSWHTIEWSSARQNVGRLQARIAKAAREQQWRMVRRLQKLLVRSTTAKALAVRRVTENQGRNTPGVDRIIWSTPAAKLGAISTLQTRGYHPKPLRRIHIPKANGGKRPLGIPTMRDRAMQALHWLALDPVAETLGDANSYGFRTGRSTTDAQLQCRNVLNKAASSEWVLEGDIQGCFDNISHDWLLRNIPMDRVILSRWLKAGFMEGKRLFPTHAGTPQGGIISPTLANLALDGLGRLLDTLPRRKKVNFIRYADDFVVTGPSKDYLGTTVKPMIARFLAERGLTLSEAKTRITHMSEGFDFLGWHFRRHDKFLLVLPSKKNSDAFYAKVSNRLRELRTARQEDVIFSLNPIIRGWGSYHSSVHAKRSFSRMDHLIWQALWRWAKRRHPNKGLRWVKQRYFHAVKGRDWYFQVGSFPLQQLAKIPIRKPPKVRMDANPYDPAQEDYFDARLKAQMEASLMGRRKLHWLWIKQEGLCPECSGKITKATGWHVHHKVWRTLGGSNRVSNLILLHPTCHVQLHARARSTRLPSDRPVPEGFTAA